MWGGLTLALACIGIVHTFIGLMMLRGQFPGPGGPGAQGLSPETLGWLFLLMGASFVVVGWTLGAFTIYSGVCLRRHRRRTLSIVVAALNCISFPIGTTLGVFTLIVLMRPSVARLYEESPRQ